MWIQLSDYPKSLIEVYVNINFINNCCFAAITLVVVLGMVFVTSSSHYVASASRYESRSSIFTRGLIPRNSTELAEVVPIAQIKTQVLYIKLKYL